MGFGLDAVIADELTGEADPGTVLECAELNFRVSPDLFGDAFDLTGLDIELTLEDFNGTEGADTGLIALDGSEVIGTGCFRNSRTSFIGDSSFKNIITVKNQTNAKKTGAEHRPRFKGGGQPLDLRSIWLCALMPGLCFSFSHFTTPSRMCQAPPYDLLERLRQKGLELFIQMCYNEFCICNLIYLKK